MRRRHTIGSAVLEAVDHGLSSTPKSLPSWLLYDETGDKLFQSIMTLPEYYPTRCEHEILKDNKKSIADYFEYDHSAFNLIELGAGDAMKTKVLLRQLKESNVEFIYNPVDVSAAVLTELQWKLSDEIPELKIRPVVGRYEEFLARSSSEYDRRVILFLGANIGNYNLHDAGTFLDQLSAAMGIHDFLFIGFDLKKDPRVIQQAYDDVKGVTAEFNLNLLRRLNAELGADFKVEQFQHYPFYDPVRGAARSYLVSKMDQQVMIDLLHKKFHFKAWEPLYTEISQKYDHEMIGSLAKSAGFEIVDQFTDGRQYFCSVLLRKSGRN
jgi:L-histidine Nalpha-methyltransferase